METKGKTIRGKMKTNEVSHKPSETKQAIDNPLVDIAGKFGGEFWRETQLEMERCRKTDREETNKLLASKPNKQD